MKKIAPMLLPAAAAISFSAATWLALTDKTSSATLMAGVFAVSVLFHYFPQLESFKAFTVEAKLRETVDRAEEILGKIRRAAVSSAENTFHQLGWGNRMGSPGWAYKSQMADNTVSLLKDLGVDSKEIKRLTEPYIQLVALDLYFIVQAVVNIRLQVRRHNIEAQLAALPQTIQRDDPEVQRLLSQRDRAVPRPEGSPLEELPQKGLETLMRDLFDEDVFEEREREQLKSLIQEITSIFDEVKRTGALTERAVVFLDQYDPWEGRKRKYEELFGERAPV